MLVAVVCMVQIKVLYWIRKCIFILFFVFSSVIFNKYYLSNIDSNFGIHCNFIRVVIERKRWIHRKSYIFFLDIPLQCIRSLVILRIHSSEWHLWMVKKLSFYLIVFWKLFFSFFHFVVCFILSRNAITCNEIGNEKWAPIANIVHEANW